MKTSPIIAASALLGSAAAGVHQLKLEKVPLEQQFAVSMDHHVKSLKHKYTQKFMSQETEDIYSAQAIIKGGEDVPLENFLNAQCKLALPQFAIDRN